MEEIQQALLTALTMIATVSIGVGAKYLCSLLKRLGDKAEVQTSKIEDEKAEILLKNILDNYPKYVVTMDDVDMSHDGIEHLNLVDFLLGDEI